MGSFLRCYTACANSTLWRIIILFMEAHLWIHNCHNVTAKILSKGRAQFDSNSIQLNLFMPIQFQCVHLCLNWIITYVLLLMDLRWKYKWQNGQKTNTDGNDNDSEKSDTLFRNRAIATIIMVFLCSITISISKCYLILFHRNLDLMHALKAANSISNH